MELSKSFYKKLGITGLKFNYSRNKEGLKTDIELPYGWNKWDNKAIKLHNNTHTYKNGCEQGVAFNLKNSNIVVIDTDSKEMTDFISNNDILKDAPYTITKKGRHYPIMITDKMANEDFWNKNHIGWKEGLDLIRETIWETYDRQIIGGEKIPRLSTGEIATIIGDKTQKKKKEIKKHGTSSNAKKQPQAETEITDNTDIRFDTSEYLSLLYQAFNPEKFGDFMEWLRLGNWCYIHNSFEVFHNISSKAPNYKDEEDCKKLWNSIKKNPFAVNAGWGVIRARMGNFTLWKEFRNQYSISLRDLTDTSLGNMFQKHYGADFIAIGKKIYYWNEKYWEEDNMNVHMSSYITKRLIPHLKTHIKCEEESGEMARKLDGTITMIENVSKLNNVILCATKALQRKENIFDDKLGLLFFENGVYDCINKEFREHNSQNFNDWCYDFEYDPKTETKEVETMLEQMFPNPDDLQFIRIAFTKAFMGINSKHILFLLGDRGNNGKSSLIQFIDASLGKISASFGSDILSKPIQNSKPSPELLILKDKRFLFSQEPDTTQVWNSETIKTITGGDIITSRKLYKNEPFQFVCNGLPVVGCNGIPTFSKNDKALMFQRVRIMTIPTEFVGQEEYDMRKGEANVYLADPEKNTDKWREENRHKMIGLFIKWVNMEYDKAVLYNTDNTKSALQEHLENSDEIIMLNSVCRKCDKKKNSHIKISDIYTRLESSFTKQYSLVSFVKRLKTNTMIADHYVKQYKGKRSYLRDYEFIDNL